MEILRRLRGIFTFVFAFGGLIGFLPFSNSIDYQNDEYSGTKLLLYIFLYFIILIGLILWGIWEGDVTAEDLNKAKKNYAFMEKKCPNCWKKLPSRFTTKCPYCTADL